MEMPDIQKFYEKYGEEIHFLIVNCTDGGRETVETAEAFLQEEGYTFPVYFDTTSMGAYFYGANSIPMTWFIDAEGNLQAYYMGAMSESILQQGVDLIYTPVETE
jgi:thiol-disulfide isomerase/thioredoxin